MNPNFIRVRRACTATHRAIRDALRAFEEDADDEPLDVSFDEVLRETLDRLPRHGAEERILRNDLWAMTLMLRHDRAALAFAADLARHVRARDVETLRELVETYLVPLHASPTADAETIGDALRFDTTAAAASPPLEYRFEDAGLYTAFRVCAFPTWSALDCTGLADPQKWLRFSSHDGVHRAIESFAREHYWPALSDSDSDDDAQPPAPWQDFVVNVDDSVLRKSPRAAEDPSPRDRDRDRKSPRTPQTSPDFTKLAVASASPTRSPVRLRKRFPRLLLGGDVKFGYSPRPAGGAWTPSPRQSPTVTSGFAAALQLAMDMDAPRVSPRDSALRRCASPLSFAEAWSPSK